MVDTSRVQEFLQSQAYKDFGANPNYQMGTMDMYNSPYFGEMGSGSIGRAQDAAYEQWLQANPNTGGGMSPTGTTGGGISSLPGDTTTAPAAGLASLDPSQSTLSPNFSQYVYNMLGKGEAAANLPFQEYTGERFAGPSALQQTAFQGAQGLGGIFDTAAAQQYMNPYIQTALNPQLDLLRRQSDISLQNDLSKYTQAGAFGGSRSAIAQGLNRENLGQQMERVTGQGYKDAFDQARQQFNTQQQQNIANTNAQATLGATQQQLNQQPLDFGYQQFQESMKYPYQQATYMQSLMQGLPLQARPYETGQSGLSSALFGGLSGLALYDALYGKQGG